MPVPHSECSQRYLGALASIKLVRDSSLLDLVEEDYEFLITDKPWIGTDRSRARRCVEACVYGSLDFLGLPRFAVPAEFISGVIAFFVSPTNTLTACAFMDSCEWSENVLNGIEAPVRANDLFNHVINVRAGLDHDVERQLKVYRTKVQLGEI